MTDPLAVIYNEGQWRLSKVTALYNLQYSALKLKQYSSKIKQTIVSMVTGGPAIKYSVEVETEIGLKYSEEDGDALNISISTSQSNNSKKTKVYCGILLSWGDYNSVPESVHLPYLLERGEQKVGSAVKSALSTMFDCTITQFSFNQHQLLHFGFNFIECETSHSDKPMAFTYGIPLAEHKERLTFHFKIGDVRLLCNSVKEEATTKPELVKLTYFYLQNQIFQTYEFDITTLYLNEISLPKGSIKNNGSVKMKSPEIVNSVFTVLNQITFTDTKYPEERN